MRVASELTSSLRKYLARRELQSHGEEEPAEREPDDESESSGEARGHEQLCGSAASGQSPPAGPQWKKKDGSKPLAPVATTVTVFGIPSARGVSRAGAEADSRVIGGSRDDEASGRAAMDAVD
jgi:hypothetical protein